MNMKNILKLTLAGALMLGMTSCEEEILPQTSTVTSDQAANAPGSYDNFVSAITGSLCGQFTYDGKDNARPYDCGYPGFMLIQDIMGNDTAEPYLNWFSNWYQGQYGGPSYVYAQVPWTYYYGWIKNCNTVISLAGERPDKDKVVGAGIAYCMRALFYEDLARMYAQKTYAHDKTSETVPLVTESTSLSDLAYNPRATNEEMWAFIISDLDKAETYLKGYERTDVYTPDLSVVYGLKARAYLVMEDWANAENYAKLAQSGYSIMNDSEYTSREYGFNTPNGAWMFGCKYKSDDPNIIYNDADSNWGSLRCLEIDPDGSGCGYASNYGQLFVIDRHLYESIPASDFRKKCYVDYAIDELDSEEAIDKALEDYSDYPSWVRRSGMDASEYGHVGGLSLKFRVAGGHEGRLNQYIGFCVAVPMMRVEEMKLIEIEARGMQNETDGIKLLTDFAKTRDPQYVYGTHNEAYGNASTGAFRNEVWWQRRVEFWGEGFSTFDIKRLDKGIIRNYPGTSHPETARFNIGGYNTNGGNNHPDWMDLCIVQTETNYNYKCTNNPTPISPESDSPEWDKAW